MAFRVPELEEGDEETYLRFQELKELPGFFFGRDASPRIVLKMRGAISNTWSVVVGQQIGGYDHFWIPERIVLNFVYFWDLNA